MIPKSLKPGDKISLVAPAGRIFPHEIEFANNWAKKNNWELIYDENLFVQHDLGYYYAGNDDHRKIQFQNALDDKNTNAIWFARGGYGSVRLIDQLDFSQFIQNPKWVIGYSDVTVFHNYLNNLNIPTIHGITAKRLNTEYSEETYSTLKNALIGEKLEYEIPAHPLNILGETEGKLVGGNLSIIYSQLGSETALQGENLILFIEDWQENWYHVDRMMMALKRSGLFNKIKGIIVGSFTKMDTIEDNPNREDAYDAKTYEVIFSNVQSLGIPVAFQFPSGHIGDIRALIFGKKVKLFVDENSMKLNYL